MMTPSKLIPLCGLFPKLDKNGKTFYAGVVGNSRVFVFKNEMKGIEGQPDFELYLGGQVDTFPDWKKERKEK